MICAIALFYVPILYAPICRSVGILSAVDWRAAGVSIDQSLIAHEIIAFAVHTRESC
jgi:hypothetical protein